MVRVSIIILNYNGRGYLEKFLPVLFKSVSKDMAQVIVADNASSDGSVEYLKESWPDVEIYSFQKNYGFAEGYNIAIKRASTEFVLILNSDVEVTDGFLEPLVKYMDTNSKVAACQPKILQLTDRSRFEKAGAAGGLIDVLGYPFCRGRIMDYTETDFGQYDTEKYVFWASGACMLVRRNDFIDYGGFDADFFAHQEEIDLCFRFNARGRKVGVVPSSVVYHLGGGTLPKESPRKTYLNFRNNLLLLYKNLPNETLHSVMRWRFWLDALASLHLLLQGQFSSFLAVWRGRRDFCRMKSDFRTDRERNLQATVPVEKPVQSSFSLLFQYYVLRHHTFDRLPHTE